MEADAFNKHSAESTSSEVWRQQRLETASVTGVTLEVFLMVVSDYGFRFKLWIVTFVGLYIALQSCSYKCGGILFSKSEHYYY